MEWLPIQIERNVLWQIYSNVRLRSNGIEGMLELCLMDIDRDICASEVFQSTSMVQVEMAHYDSLDVFDIMAGLLDLVLNLMVLGIFNSCKDIV